MSDKKQNIELVREALQESLPNAGMVYGRVVHDTLIELYAEYLHDCSPQAIAMAVHSHVTNPEHGGRFPLPCDIAREMRDDWHISGAI